MHKHVESSNQENNGKLHEHMLIGDITKAKNSIPYQAALKRAFEEAGVNPKFQGLPYDAAVELVKRAQPDNPEAPRKKFLKDFREAVEKRLQKMVPGGPKTVKIYSAIGTPLDLYGVDGFITIEDSPTQSVTITFDATINDVKIEQRKRNVHILIEKIPDPVDQEREYNAAIERLANEVVTYYQLHINR